MKLLKLKLHNIASIGDAAIDFEQEPLASSEVFLITGKTGAGKSTILDAICLALFNKMPRMENTLLKKNQNKDTVIQNTLELKINDPRLIMRRGTKEALIELTFEGRNGKHYLSSWGVSRARTGTLQAVKWSLKIIEDNTMLTKSTPINEEINRAIGLDFTQFCRTTMLAQGEFTKFLNSLDEDKSAILEKITGVDIYTKIGVKIFEIYNQKRHDWEDANQRLENVHALSDEELKEITDKKAQDEEKYALKTQQQTTINKKLQWLLNDKTLKDEIDKAQKSLDDARQKKESDDFKKKDSLVKDWNATIDARNWLSNRNRAAAETKRLNGSLDGLLSEYEKILEGLLWLEKHIEEKKNELQATRQFLKAHESKKEVYSQEQTISSLLKSISGCRESIKKEQKDIENAKLKIDGDLKDKLEKANSDLEKKQDSVESNKYLLNKLDQELAAMKLHELRNKKEELNNININCNTALLLIDSLKKEKNGVEAIENAIKSTKKSIGELEIKLKQQNEEKKNAEDEYIKEKAVCDKLKESVDEWAKNIRSKLKVNDVCPVCQQKISSELPHEEVLESIVAQAETKVRELEDLLTEKKDNCNATNAEISALQKQLGEKSNELEKAKKSLDNESLKTLDACRKCGINSLDDNTKQQVEELQNTTNGQLELAKQQVETGEMKENERNKQNKLVITLQQELTDASNKVNKIKEDIGKCETEIQSSSKIIKTKQNELTTHQNEVEELVGSNEWDINWKVDPQQFAIELKQIAKLFQQHVEKEKQQVSDIDNALNDFNNAKESINSIVAVMPGWHNVAATGKHEVRNLIKSANELNATISSLQAQISKSRKEENEISALLDEWLKENNSLSIENLVSLSHFSQREIEETQESLKRILDSVLQSQTTVDNCNNRLRAHNEERPEFAEDETQDSLSDMKKNVEDSIRILGEQIGGYKEKLEYDTKQKEEQAQLIIECDKKKEIYDKWSRLSKLLGDSDGKRFRNIALSFILENLIHSANAFMKNLTDRYRLTVERGTFYILVEDAYQSYVRRPASTISGGESFLVSLALALALSDIAQQLRVDVLFIDEGFGTLSGEPLQNAINTLRALHNTTGRQVGIISHVEELKEKIPVQIQVNQEGNTASSTVEVVSL